MLELYDTTTCTEIIFIQFYKEKIIMIEVPKNEGQNNMEDVIIII